MNSFRIRDAARSDLPRIVEIYNASIPGRMATGDLSPVSVESREAWFNAHSPAKYPLIVAETNDRKIIGWASLSVFFNGRAAYRHTAEVSIYVAPESCRQGVASALMDELRARCPKQGIRSLSAWIFGHNDASKRFFEREGFTLWGKMPGIADMDGVERDLDIYGLRLGGPPEGWAPKAQEAATGKS
ncbi:MAG TPA: GNAT family N-acetyltransferase [Planctomycetota bacterium]|nr:GNAT family N-acetyltransferase [Planctomycetota bacterium]